ncbi:kinase-like protein, partial [Obba rivulosa]
QALVREVETWISLRHDHIVPCYGASTSADPPFIVLRYMQHGHLLQYLHTFSDANRVRLVFGVSLGLRYLHGERIVHGDIKGVNILVDDAGKACITDFGLAFKVESARKDEPPKRAAGTLRYMAPELIKTGRLAYATDVYAFGMLIYETFTGRPPFLLDSDSDVHSGHLMLERPEALEIRDRGLTDEMWDLLQACASREAVNRPTARDITTRTTSMAKKWSPRSPLTNASTASDNPHSGICLPFCR